MSDSNGRRIGRGVGPDVKWAGRSRSFAAMWMPVLALVVTNAGGTEADAEQLGEFSELLDQLIMALGSLGGVVMYVWHRFRPDAALLTVQPYSRNAAALLLALALILPGVSPIGCARARAWYTGQPATPAASIASQWVLAVKSFEGAQHLGLGYINSPNPNPIAVREIRRVSRVGTGVIRASGSALVDRSGANITLQAVTTLTTLTAELLAAIGA